VYIHTHVYVCVLVDIFEGMTNDENLSMTLISEIHMISAFEVALCIHTHIYTHVYIHVSVTHVGVFGVVLCTHIYIYVFRLTHLRACIRKSSYVFF